MATLRPGWWHLLARGPSREGGPAVASAHRAASVLCGAPRLLGSQNLCPCPKRPWGQRGKAVRTPYRALPPWPQLSCRPSFSPAYSLPTLQAGPRAPVLTAHSGQRAQDFWMLTPLPSSEHAEQAGRGPSNPAGA